MVGQWVARDLLSWLPNSKMALSSAGVRICEPTFLYNALIRVRAIANSIGACMHNMSLML